MNSPYKGKFKVTQQFKGSSHDGLDLVGLENKNIYSTIDGTVEKAGWENPINKKQGFGLYVRIKKKGGSDKYYFGHLSKINVTKGQTVKKGELLGTEGNTGRSTGSHCHYCVRGNGSKKQIQDICVISGIPNKLGIYNPDDSVIAETVKKSIAEIAEEIIGGKWGNGDERKKKLENAGYDYKIVQSEVNKIWGKKTASSKKSNSQIAKEVISGKWGNGAERKKRLTDAGHNYKEIQKAVNKLMKG